nr:hypothetical protein [uncultured Flavobacterium sp.]
MAKKITSYQLAFSPITNTGRILFTQDGSSEIIQLQKLSPDVFTATAIILETGMAYAEGPVIFMENTGSDMTKFDTPSS